MKLAKLFDQAIGFVVGISLLIIFGVFINVTVHNTFAEEVTLEEAYQAEGAKFVTFYDGTKKLIVKTDAQTVGEALARTNITLGAGDMVEPGLDAVINADNYFVNIHRARPVVVKDGKITKYLMSTSYDIRTIAAEAGLTFYDGDEVELLPNTEFLETGVAEVYKIVRNGGRTLTVEEEIPYSERTEKSYDLDPGVTEVRQLGEVGVKRTTYRVEYVDSQEVLRELVSEEVVKQPVERVTAVGAAWIERHPLTPSRGAQVYSYTKDNGVTVDRKETFYDLDMHLVMQNCGGSGYYTVREDGVKVDKDGYVIVAAHLGNYPRCTVVETSLGAGKVYDTGSFATRNSEQFDLATDWTVRDGI